MKDGAVAARTALTIGRVFRRVVVINLDRRPDRWVAVRAQAARHGIEVERIAAVDGAADAVRAEWQAYAASALARLPPGHEPVTGYRDFYLGDGSPEARLAFFEGARCHKAIRTPGAWGLLKTFAAVMRRALEEGWETVLVLEDDVLFHRDFPILFPRFMAQVPADWRVLQLGALQLHWEPDWIEWRSDNLYRCNGSSIGAHAVGLHRETFRPLIELCGRLDFPVDIGPLNTVKRRYADRCFTMFPNLCIQDAGDTEIGSSDLFLAQARRPGNIYRWHLPDYGLDAGSAAGTSVGASATGRGEGRGGGAGRVAEAGPSLRALAGQWIGRLPLKPRRSGSAGGTAASPAAAAPPAFRHQGAAAAGEPPLGPVDRPDVRALAVVTVGLDGKELEHVLDIVGRSRTGALFPVLLTDCDAFEPFRRRRLAFEYFPPESVRQRFCTDLDWDLYRLRRLALIRRKWQPVGIVGFGPGAGAWLREWRDSPFEDAGIADLIADRP